MSKPEFVYVSYIATTPERLWEALTRGEFTKTYWYERRIESSWMVGAPVVFYDGDSDVRTDGGVVLACDPPRLLSYSFQPEFSEEARSMGTSRVTFTLEPHDGMVKLTLVHDELPSEEMAAGFREGTRRRTMLWLNLRVQPGSILAITPHPSQDEWHIQEDMRWEHRFGIVRVKRTPEIPHGSITILRGPISVSMSMWTFPTAALLLYRSLSPASTETASIGS